MSIYFEEARKLGHLLLASEQGLRLVGANALYDADAVAQEKMQAFTALRDETHKNAHAGEMPQEALAKLTQMQADLRENKTIAEIIAAEEAFGILVNQTMDILKATVMGVSEPENGTAGGCGSGCASCGGGCA